MTAARLVLERSTMMLLTSSKVRLRRRPSIGHWFIFDLPSSFFVSTDKSETSRMYIFQGEPWYGLLPNEKGHGLNTLRRQRRRAGDIKRTKRIETSEFTSLVPSSVDWIEAPDPTLITSSLDFDSLLPINESKQNFYINDDDDSFSSSSHSIE